MWRRISRILRLGAIAATIFAIPALAIASTVTWSGYLNPNSSVDLLFVGTKAQDSAFTATASIIPDINSGCFYTACSFPGNYHTAWQVSTTVSVNGYQFVERDSNCNSPDSCFGLSNLGNTFGYFDHTLLVSVGSIYADQCSTTDWLGNASSCVGTKSGEVNVSISVLDASGSLVVLPLPPTLPMLASALLMLFIF